MRAEMLPASTGSPCLMDVPNLWGTALMVLTVLWPMFLMKVLHTILRRSRPLMLNHPSTIHLHLHHHHRPLPRLQDQRTNQQQLLLLHHPRSTHHPKWSTTHHALSTVHRQQQPLHHHHHLQPQLHHQPQPLHLLHPHHQRHTDHLPLLQPLHHHLLHQQLMDRHQLSTVHPLQPMFQWPTNLHLQPLHHTNQHQFQLTLQLKLHHYLNHYKSIWIVF